MHEYSPGDMIPVSSPLYRVVHNPPARGEQLQTFFAGDRFPRCSGCGKNVRYLLSSTILALREIPKA
jgi:hypothetical protein